MADPFIEVAIVSVVAGGVVGGATKILIGTNHIISIAPGAHNTSAMTLSNGKSYNVKETYDDLKKILGIP
jgi:hypothetical protein